MEPVRWSTDNTLEVDILYQHNNISPRALQISTAAVNPHSIFDFEAPRALSMDFVWSTLSVGAAIAATIVVVVASTTAGSKVVSALLEPFTVLVVGDADKRTETPLSEREREDIQDQRRTLKIMPTSTVLMLCFAYTLAMAAQEHDIGLWEVNVVVIQVWLQVIVAFGMLRLGLATYRGLFVR
ncbi:MAG: Uncharacterized protein AUREO_046650 [Aureobasidium pullulans]|nr:MAG: Uncharacterized protein AUREO_046650 [Aureobasidium pullulans]